MRHPGHRWNAASHGQRGLRLVEPCHETRPGLATVPESLAQRLVAPERLDGAKGKEEEKRRHRNLSLGQKMKKLVQGRSEAKEAAIK